MWCLIADFSPHTICQHIVVVAAERIVTIAIMYVFTRFLMLMFAMAIWHCACPCERERECVWRVGMLACWRVGVLKFDSMHFNKRSFNWKGEFLWNVFISSLSSTSSVWQMGDSNRGYWTLDKHSRFHIPNLVISSIEQHFFTAPSQCSITYFCAPHHRNKYAYRT